MEKGYNNVFLLSGGMEEFLEEYPDLVEGKKLPDAVWKKRKQKPGNQNEKTALEDQKELNGQIKEEKKEACEAKSLIHGDADCISVNGSRVILKETCHPDLVTRKSLVLIRKEKEARGLTEKPNNILYDSTTNMIWVPEKNEGPKNKKEVTGKPTNPWGGPSQ